MFQLGGLVGPGLSGLLIGAVGVGWCFAINAAGYLPVVVALLLIDPGRLRPVANSARGTGQLREGLRYIHDRPRLLWLVVLVGVMGALGLNMPVVLTTYSTTVFHLGPLGYGAMSSMLAVGSVAGALLSARRGRMRLRSVVAAAGVFGLLQATAALAPDPAAYALLLIGVGAASLTFLTGANTAVQLGSDTGGARPGDEHLSPGAARRHAVRRTAGRAAHHARRRPVRDARVRPGSGPRRHRGGGPVADRAGGLLRGGCRCVAVSATMA